MNKNKGFIALSSVLILSALFLSLSIGVTTGAVGSTQNIINILNESKAKYLAYACSEYALVQTIRNLHYDGNESIFLDGGLCEIETIENTGGSIAIHTQSTINEHTYRVIVVVSEISPDMNLSSYKSVLNF